MICWGEDVTVILKIDFRLNEILLLLSNEELLGGAHVVPGKCD